MKNLAMKFQQFLRKFKCTSQLFDKQKSNQNCIKSGIQVDIKINSRLFQKFISVKPDNLNCSSGLDPP